jgi:hypothetical protein
MQTLTLDSTPSRMPPWLWAAAILGSLWNIYGVVQFAGTFTTAGQAAMTAGMSPEQAAIYLGLPAWIGVVFAFGVFGGLAGSIALALRWRIAVPVLAASLVGYVLLFAGDAGYGVFAAMPGRLAILAVVVLIAAGLFWTARIAARRSLLRR